MPVLQPRGTTVLLEINSKRDQMAADVKKSSGLLVPEKMIEGQPNTGYVYSCGPDVPEERQYIIGDKVVFKTDEIFQGFTFEGKKLISIDHTEIIANMA